MKRDAEVIREAGMFAIILDEKEASVLKGLLGKQTSQGYGFLAGVYHQLEHLGVDSANIEMFGHVEGRKNVPIGSGWYIKENFK